MITDREIWQTAGLMIKRHGHEAAIQAAMRADEMLEAGDVVGAATWKAIMRAIDQLQDETPTGGVH